MVVDSTCRAQFKVAESLRFQAMVVKPIFISGDWGFCRQNWQHGFAAKDPLDQVDHSYNTQNPIALGGSWSGIHFRIL